MVRQQLRQSSCLLGFQFALDGLHARRRENLFPVGNVIFCPRSLLRLFAFHFFDELDDLNAVFSWTDFGVFVHDRLILADDKGPTTHGHSSR